MMSFVVLRAVMMVAPSRRATAQRGRANGYRVGGDAESPIVTCSPKRYVRYTNALRRIVYPGFRK
jgi:hypothetical protein